MVGCNIISMIVYEVVSVSIGIVIKFWQYIGLCFYVIYDIVVMIIVESIILIKV